MDNKENKNIKKNKVLKLTALLGLFLLVFGISYALFSVVLEGTKKNRISTANFGLILTDKDGVEEKNLPEGSIGINLENAVPISAKEAIETIEPYEFNITNTGSIPVDYEIYLEPSDSTNLDASNIKYSLTRSDTGEILSFNYAYNLKPSMLTDETSLFYEPLESKSFKFFMDTNLLSQVKTTKESKTLYKLDLGTIGPNQTQKYSLKMWVSYASTKEAMGKEFEGKLKIYGNQSTKDSAYPIEQVNITENDEATTMLGGQIFAKLYSDNSMRFSGFGSITKDMLANDKYSIMEARTMLDCKILLSDINELLSTNGYDEYTDINTLLVDIINDSTLGGKIEEINFDEYIKQSDFINLYIEDGILGIGEKGTNDPLFTNPAVEKIYISSTVQEIYLRSFSYMSNLKEIEFVKAKDNVLYNAATSEGLTVKSGAFSSNTNLTKVHILNNLKSIEDSPFSGCTNAEITIEALQSNVTLSSTAFQDVKSVTWLNG